MGSDILAAIRFFGYNYFGNFYGPAEKGYSEILEKLLFSSCTAFSQASLSSNDFGDVSSYHAAPENIDRGEI